MPLPLFACASSLIAIWPFRYLWYNPPRFTENHAWLAVATASTVFFAVAIGFTALSAICWTWWHSPSE
jgi:hypothetical protein